jgi:hypothetical protein
MSTGRKAIIVLIAVGVAALAVMRRKSRRNKTG